MFWYEEIKDDVVDRILANTLKGTCGSGLAKLD